MGNFECMRWRGDDTIVSRYGGYIGRCGNDFGLDFIPQRLDGMRGWSDEFDFPMDVLLTAFIMIGIVIIVIIAMIKHNALDSFGKVAIFRQESIPRMHTLAVRHAHCLTDLIDIQITGTRRGVGTKTDGLIGHGDMRRPGVGTGVDGHGLDAMLACGFDDADGNLASIGNENFA